MDPSTLERIFDPFFTTKGPREGTGLGLAVVHGIMRNHEGIVTVTSEPGKGTTFHLYFPAIEGHTPAQSPEETTVPTGKGQHLLVIDDEPVLTRLVARTLERLGYRVTAHTQATEALADFMSRPDEFDLVFSDFTMPRITGVELAGHILRRRPDIPVLLTSGYSGSLDPQELQRLGVRELVGKPFVTRIVAEAIARQLHNT
jgi:CheY-like chemotaxis protein